MRSFVGLLHHDGRPPDARRIEQLAAAIRLPASSEPAFFVDDRFALAVVSHRETEPPPIARDGNAVLAGTMGLEDSQRALQAWKQWGSDCVSHLSGDFSFVVRDPVTGCFCARDRFGVRPFYYARTDGALIVSDSLDAILAHPDVRAEELDDGAVAGYLSSGVVNDPEATVYANVRRLPPAHILIDHGIRRYWTLELPERERSGKDAPAILESALKESIADRVTGDSAVVFLSGGLDSAALAALTREARPGARLLAFTSVYRSRIADVEEPYAVEAARSIGIPIRCFPLDDYSPLHALETGMWTADPGSLLTASMTRDIHAIAAEHAPVALHGHPADALFLTQLTPWLRKQPFAKQVAALIQYTVVKRRPPYFFFRDLAGWPRRRPTPTSAVHALQSATWSSYFEWAHPLMTRAPIELVYPWCDPRVIEAALAMPPIPWLVDKHVLRRMLRGRVSERIRTRKKSYLQGDPWQVPLPCSNDLRIEAASRFIDPGRFAEACRSAGALSDATLRAIGFEYWLRQLPERAGRCAR